MPTNIVSAVPARTPAEMIALTDNMLQPRYHPKIDRILARTQTHILVASFLHYPFFTSSRPSRPDPSPS
jgi:hypothetical protein